MPGDLYVGGGVYMPIETGVDYWPVAGVTEPQHHWPFVVTGDYTDQGSTGGYDLTEQGTGNSFNENGLVVNGSGWAANTSIGTDITDLGATWSILFEYTPSDKTGTQGGIYIWKSFGDTTYLSIVDFGSGLLRWVEAGATYEMADKGISNGNPYQIVITHASGATNVYVNNVKDAASPYSQSDPGSNTNTLWIGKWDAYALKGTIKRVGILKGTAWSADDVAAIYAAFS